jgi:hypothetical protein
VDLGGAGRHGLEAAPDQRECALVAEDFVQGGTAGYVGKKDSAIHGRLRLTAPFSAMLPDTA